MAEMVKMMDLEIDMDKIEGPEKLKRVDVLRFFINLSLYLQESFLEEQECSSPSIVSPVKRKELSMSRL